MSLSNPRVSSPILKNFKWKGAFGTVSAYDTTTRETTEVPMPAAFVVLDTRSAVSGYCEPEQSSIWSNKIADVSKDILSARTKRGVFAKGTWKDIKGECAALGGKFATILYVAYKDKGDDNFKLGQFEVVGSSLTAWIDYTSNKNKAQVGGMNVTLGNEKKKGATIYFEPCFEPIVIPDHVLNLCKDIDRDLQEYFKLSASVQDSEESVFVEDYKEEATEESEQSEEAHDPFGA
jgi:hypothetical protein